ncbi:MAG: hypothetical protein AAF354_15390 [Pseudomonadota bacterium]
MTVKTQDRIAIACFVAYIAMGLFTFGHAYHRILGSAEPASPNEAAYSRSAAFLSATAPAAAWPIYWTITLQD